MAAVGWAEDATAGGLGGRANIPFQQNPVQFDPGAQPFDSPFQYDAGTFNQVPFDNTGFQQPAIPPPGTAPSYNDVQLFDQQLPPNEIAGATDATYAALLNNMDQELPFYDRYFGMIDTLNTGFADADQTADLYRRSGLDDATLECIWQFANPSGSPVLDKGSFAVGCRLIAHAQNGLPVTMDIISVAPPSLPYFDMPDLGTPEAPDFPPAMHQGVENDGFLPPAPQYIDPQMNTQFGFTEGGAGPLSHTDAEYEAWFTILDESHAGFIEGETARAFLQQSGLNDDQLYAIWEQSDMDQDGRLSLTEFLMACRLVAETLNSSGGDGLPVAEQASASSATLMATDLPQAAQASFAPSGTGLDPFQPAAAAADPWASDAVGGDERKEDKPAETGGTTDAPPTSKSRKKKSKKNAGDEDDNEVEDIHSEVLPSFGDLVKNESKRSSKSKVDEESDEFIFKSHRVDHKRRDEIEQEIAGDEEDSLLLRIRKRLQKSTGIDFADVRALLLLIERLKESNLADQKELFNLAIRKEEFQREIEEMRLEFELLKEERRLLDTEKVSRKKDLESLAELSSIYSREIDEMRRDIKTLTDSNAWLNSTLLSAKQQSENMDLARKSVIREIEDEKNRVEELEREINELKMEVEKLRRTREELRSTVLVNEEHCRNADQDRHLMISGLEQQRQKLQEWRQNRMDTVAEKEKLLETVVTLHGKWDTSHPHTYPVPSITPASAAAVRREAYRDKKGVPNSVSYSNANAPPRQPENLTRSRAQWEKFSSQPTRNLVSGRQQPLTTSLEMLQDPLDRSKAPDVDQSLRETRDFGSSRDGRKPPMERDRLSWKSQRDGEESQKQHSTSERLSSPHSDVAKHTSKSGKKRSRSRNSKRTVSSKAEEYEFNFN